MKRTEGEDQTSSDCSDRRSHAECSVVCEGKRRRYQSKKLQEVEIQASLPYGVQNIDTVENYVNMDPHYAFAIHESLKANEAKILPSHLAHRSVYHLSLTFFLSFFLDLRSV